MRVYTSDQLHLGNADDGDTDLIGKAYLEHSCDEWVIGGLEEVKALIADLQVLLARMEAQSAP